MKQYLLVFITLCFLVPSTASTLPDSLVRKLNTAQGGDRLEVWIDWFSDFEIKQASVFEDAIEDACQDAYSVLKSDSAFHYCFMRKLNLANNLKGQLDFQSALSILKTLKPQADSIAAIHGGKHILLAEWHYKYGTFHYSKTDMNVAHTEFDKAIKMFHELGNHSKDFFLYRSKALAYAWVKRDKEAFKYYALADSVGEYDKNIKPKNKLYTKYAIGLLHNQLENFELAADYYNKVIPHLDSFSTTNRRRITIDYLNNACILGNSSKSLPAFKKLRIELLEAEDQYNLTMLHRYYANCLVSIGKTKEAGILNNKYITEIEKTIGKRNSREILEWQSKYEAQEREGDIIALELEKESNQSKFQLRLALIALFSLLTISILTFLLYRNKTKQRQALLSQERDQQIAENRDRLFSSITHDIRTPLALMLAPLERADERSTEHSVKEDIQMARRHGKRLLELFNQILDWNKAEAKALSINKQVGQLDLSFGSMCQRYEHQAFEAGVDFQKRIEVPHEQYLLDYDKLDKIVSNLVGNAIKFTDKGKAVILKAKVEKQNNQEVLSIEVKDEGPGIAKAEQEKLFDRYFQGAAGKEKGGSGIGLALVKELVDMFKGNIELNSDSGKGAIFNVIIPIEAVKLPFIVTPDVTNESLNSGNANEEPLVLLIEDEPDLLKFLHSSLVNDYEVEVANTTSVGLSIAISRIPDLIICDWMLPDNNGGWLSKEIKKNPLTAHIPILILTAQNDDATRKEAFESGAVALMGKPFTLATLKQQLKTILDQQRNVQKSWQDQKGSSGSISDTENAPSDPFINEVTQLIEQNMDDEYYSVEKMAEQLTLSRVQLFRKVRSLTGKSPSVLLKEFRMDKAKALLQQPGKTIAEIAYAVGFSDPSYFSKVYKKYFNTSPTQDQAS